MSYSEKEASIIINMISGIGSAKLEALCSRFGSPSKILERSEKELASVPGIGSKLANAVVSWKDSLSLEKELEIAEKGGVEIISRYDDKYPQILKEIYDPPICLYIRGEIPLNSERSIAIVGSRRMSHYGRKMTRHLAESAAYAGWTVISGLAYGVDAEAHQASIDAGGDTVAVLGGGLSRIHPQEHIPLARKIVDHGAVITEFPMEFPVNRQSFPRRNRIVSGLSRAVLVVEAGLNSGALITANLALEQGRMVFAVPGCADNPQAAGCNALIKQGAKLTERFEDILEEFEFLPGFARVNEDENGYSPGETADSADAEKSAESDPDEKKILEVLKKGQSGLDSISEATSIPAGKLLSILMRMEIKKLVKQLPGKIYTISC